MRSPYDFDLDSAIALMLSVGAGIGLTIWGCYSPSVQIFNGVAGCLGGAAALVESQKLHKSEKRSKLREAAEETILIDDLTHQYAEVMSGQPYLVPAEQQLPQQQLPQPKHPLPIPIQTSDQNVHELWNRLQKPEYEWLLQLLLTKPLLIWGAQGSGKSQIAQFIALLRQLFFAHEVTVADPHSHINQWCFECYEAGYNYSEINQRLKAYNKRLKNPDVSHTSIWDEVTQYEENCKSDESKRFLKSVLSDVRKPPEFPILISHNNTLSSLGGGKGGVKKMQIQGLPELELRASRDRLGNIKPAYCGILTNTNEEGEMAQQAIIVEPDWMNAEYLINKFPYLADSQPVSMSNKPANPGKPHSQTFYNIDLGKKPLDVDVVENDATPDDSQDNLPAHLPEVGAEVSGSAVVSELTRLTGKSKETIQVAIQALLEGKSQTYVIEKILKMKGRDFRKGKNLIALIREYL